MDVSTLLSTFAASLIFSAGCSSPPQAVERPGAVRLAGRWSATPATGGFQAASLDIYFDPDVPGMLGVALTFTGPPAGLDVERIVSYALASDTTYVEGDSISLQFSLDERSSAKENCDGDNSINPNEPLCPMLGGTTLRGVLRHNVIGATFSQVRCTEHPGFPPCRDPLVNISGPITFHLVERW